MPLRAISIRVSDLARSIGFYRGLGMEVLARSAKNTRSPAHARLGYRPVTPGARALYGWQLQLVAQPQRDLTHHPAYWKIGILVDDLDATLGHFDGLGTASSAGVFEDVGYLCHLEDPDGFSIELLQRTFPVSSSRGSAPLNPRPPVSAISPLDRAQIAHTTLRAGDRQRSLSFYRERLGLSLVGTLPVSSHGFVLDFLADDQQAMPGTLSGREAATWLWQRPYPCLELQSKLASADTGPGALRGPASPDPVPQRAGAAELQSTLIGLSVEPSATGSVTRVTPAGTGIVLDPDRIPICLGDPQGDPQCQANGSRS